VYNFILIKYCKIFFGQLVKPIEEMALLNNNILINHHIFVFKLKFYFN